MSNPQVINSETTDTQVVPVDISAQVVVDAPTVHAVTLEAGGVATAQTDDISLVSVGTQGPAGPTGQTGPAGTVSTLSLEAGENLVVGDPVYVSANKFYKADHTLAAGCIGVITTAALVTGLAVATLSGIIPLTGLSAGSPYFLGVGVISVAAPISGYIIRLGKALSTTSLLLNVEEPILLN